MAVNVQGGALTFEALVASGQFQNQINNIERSLQGLTKTAENEARAIDNIVSKTTAAIAAYASVATATNFIGDIARVRGEFQQLEVAFTTMLGSKEEADKLMARVTNFAATTPFELKEVAAATKSLLAFGVAAGDIEPTLRSLGDISAGIGAPIKDIAELFGKAKVQGRLFQEDINQLTNRGIPIIQELAKQFGVTEDKVRNLVESGEVGFPNLEQAFKDLTAEGSKFGGLMAAQAETISGLQSNFSDAVTRMLNDLGQANEGFIADTIKGAIAVVENYDKVIDVIKILVVTYGSYKAAVIAYNSYTAIQTAIASRYTFVELLRYRAMLLSETAMKLLNRTMLANPFVAVATGVAALVSAFLILRKETAQVKTAQELLADAQGKVGDRMAEAEAKIRPYVEALKNANLSEQERVNIYNKLKEIDPKIVEGIDAKKLSYDKLVGSVNNYLSSLRTQIAIETNRSALTESIKSEQSLQKQIEDTRKKYIELDNSIKSISKSGQGAQALEGLLRSRAAQGKQLDDLKKQLKQQQDVSSEIDQTIKEIDKPAPDTGQQGKPRTVKVIEDEIKAVKELQSTQSDSKKKFDEFQNQIAAKEKELAAIRGASKSEIKAQQTEENKLNQLLEKRKDLLQLIEDLKRGASQSGLVKEQSELDKINEKYDDAILKIDDYNKKVEQTGKGQKVGQLDINALNEARQLELRNANLKQDAERFKENLQVQKGIFEQFEEAKKQIGIEKAEEMFKEQAKGFSSYADFLKSEFAKLTPKIVLGIGNVGDAEKFKALMKALSEETKKQTEEQIQQFSAVLKATNDFVGEKAILDAKYDEQFKALEKGKTLLTEEEYKRRLEALKNSQSEETDALRAGFVRQSELYKKLGQDLILQTRDDLKKRLVDLKKILADGFVIENGKKTLLTPEMVAALKSAIQGTQNLVDNTNETAIAAGKVAKQAQGVKSALSAAAQVASLFNSDLAEGLTTMGSLADVAATAATAVGQFASGDIVGGIGSAISGIASLASTLFGESPEERAFHERLRKIEFENLNGEAAVNELYRERAREQIRINELRIAGIQKETDLLKQQSKDIQKDYEDVFSKLQKLKFTATQEQVDQFLASNPNLSAFDFTLAKTFHLLPLLGKTFEDLEKLNMFGQLSGDAKELFDQLEKLKNEGVDVNKALADAQKELQETVTGTTQDSIADSIVGGFEKGLSSAQDFAGTFEDLMKKAILNSLKFKYLEAPLKTFFDEFASAADSNGTLNDDEVKQLNDKFNSIINAANVQFQKLQQVSGIDFSSITGNQNSLAGGIKTIQEDTAQLLAGQFGGLRLTAIEQLQVAQNQLDKLSAIQFNTAETVAKLEKVNDTMVNFFRNEGIKLK